MYRYAWTLPIWQLLLQRFTVAQFVYAVVWLHAGTCTVMWLDQGASIQNEFTEPLPTWCFCCSSCEGKNNWILTGHNCTSSIILQSNILLSVVLLIGFCGQPQMKWKVKGKVKGKLFCPVFHSFWVMQKQELRVHLIVKLRLPRLRITQHTVPALRHRS